MAAITPRGNTSLTQENGTLSTFHQQPASSQPHLERPVPESPSQVLRFNPQPPQTTSRDWVTDTFKSTPSFKKHLRVLTVTSLSNGQEPPGDGGEEEVRTLGGILEGTVHRGVLLLKQVPARRSLAMLLWEIAFCFLVPTFSE